MSCFLEEWPEMLSTYAHEQFSKDFLTNLKNNIGPVDDL